MCVVGWASGGDCQAGASTPAPALASWRPFLLWPLAHLSEYEGMVALHRAGQADTEVNMCCVTVPLPWGPVASSSPSPVCVVMTKNGRHGPAAASSALLAAAGLASPAARTELATWRGAGLWAPGRQHPPLPVAPGQGQRGKKAGGSWVPLGAPRHAVCAGSASRGIPSEGRLRSPCPLSPAHLQRSCPTWQVPQGSRQPRGPRGKGQDLGPCGHRAVTSDIPGGQTEVSGIATLSPLA